MVAEHSKASAIFSMSANEGWRSLRSNFPKYDRSIEVRVDDVQLTPVKLLLREMVIKLSVSLFNGGGNELNARQLGKN